LHDSQPVHAVVGIHFITFTSLRALLRLPGKKKSGKIDSTGTKSTNSKFMNEKIHIVCLYIGIDKTVVKILKGRGNNITKHYKPRY